MRQGTVDEAPSHRSEIDRHEAWQVALVRFKRDLMNLGMTEPQVHEIFPVYPKPPTSAAPQAVKPASTPSTPAG